MRNGLDDIILATHLFRPARLAMRLMPWNWGHRSTAPRGERVRRALEELGPIFVKFGQIVSTRRDLLPDDIAVELAKLQDSVPPFPGDEARAIVERAYRKPVTEVFATFDETPLASASIAQVHAAQLHDGRQVIVKVVRPGIEKQIRRDIDLLYTIADLAARYWPDGRRLRPVEVVADYEKTIFNELDMMREAANAAQLKRNFTASPLLYVPEVHWPYTRPDVLVMERIAGIPISNIEGLRAAGIDFQKLAESGVQIFFHQVFVDNFFHADMHPGNIFVSKQGQYIAVDFGIMGTLMPEDQRYLAENFLAFFNRDYRRVAELHVESGWVPSGTRIDEFESAIRSVCDPIFERPLKDISFGLLLVRLFQTARQFNMEVQPQLVLLEKTLLNIEGLGRQLYPDLDLWKTAKPFFERWMDEQIGMRAVLKSLRDNAPRLAQALPHLPLLLHDVLNKAQHGKLEIQWRAPELEKLRDEIRTANRRTYIAIIGGACIIGAALIKGLDGYAPSMVGNAPMLTWLLAGLGAWLVISHWPTKED
ncbi:MAG: ubiquinone biosynthesis protein [Gammaproteobacteria bacterium]|nr:MAG: ubiquinone biosynthesis protein [Gammaproteobacteria bacterium]TND05774.1 MAG: ubiquinone biosynthesis protein [Gammaproteobacteria bacterium]